MANGDYKNNKNSDVITKNELGLNILEGISKINDESNQNHCAIFIEDKTANSDKVLEVLEVLENQKQIEDR